MTTTQAKRTRFRVRFGDQYLAAAFDSRTGVNHPYLASADFSYCYDTVEEAECAGLIVRQQFGKFTVEEFELGGRS